MPAFSSFKKYALQDDGSFASTVIMLVVIGAILAIAIIDGSSVLYAYSAVNRGTEEAAKIASEDYQTYHSNTMAIQDAIDHCEAKGLIFIDIQKAPELSSNAYSVTCAKDAKTYVFKHLPYLKNLIHQEETSTSYQSY